MTGTTWRSLCRIDAEGEKPKLFEYLAHPGPERDMCRQGWNEMLDKLDDYLAKAQADSKPK